MTNKELTKAELRVLFDNLRKTGIQNRDIFDNALDDDGPDAYEKLIELLYHIDIDGVILNPIADIVPNEMDFMLNEFLNEEVHSNLVFRKIEVLLRDGVFAKAHDYDSIYVPALDMTIITCYLYTDETENAEFLLETVSGFVHGEHIDEETLKEFRESN